MEAVKSKCKNCGESILLAGSDLVIPANQCIWFHEFKDHSRSTTCGQDNPHGTIAEPLTDNLKVCMGCQTWREFPTGVTFGFHNGIKYATELCEWCLKQEMPDPAEDEYRKKPVVVKASRWFKDGDHPEVDRYYPVRKCSACNETPFYHGWVDARYGGHIVCPGDWIIKGVAGEFYPCKPDIFEQTYEKVEPGWGENRDVAADISSVMEQVASGTAEKHPSVIGIGGRLFKTDDPEDMRELAEIIGEKVGPEKAGRCQYKRTGWMHAHRCKLFEGHSGPHEMT